MPSKTQITSFQSLNCVMGGILIKKNLWIDSRNLDYGDILIPSDTDNKLREILNKNGIVFRDHDGLYQDYFNQVTSYLLVKKFLPMKCVSGMISTSQEDDLIDAFNRCVRAIIDPFVISIHRDSEMQQIVDELLTHRRGIANLISFSKRQELVVVARRVQYRVY